MDEPARAERVPATVIPWRICPQLTGWVQSFVGFVEHGAGVPRRELPIVGTPLLFVLGAPYQLSEHGRPGVLTARHHGFHAGMFDVFTVSQSTGPSEVIQVDLTPFGAYRITGIPMRETTNTLFPLEEIFGKHIRALEERLANTPDWTMRFQLVEQYLCDRLVQGPAISGEVAWAWSELCSANGNVPISSLTDELGWGRKRLLSAFQEQIGISPKRSGKLIRFRHTLDVLMSDTNATWSRIALDAGYFDQAHMNRDVRAFSGTTPTTLRDELIAGTFVQDIPPEAR